MKVKKILVCILIALIMITIGANVSKAVTEDKFHNFTGMYIITKSVKNGEKVYVDFYGDKKEIKAVRAEVVYNDVLTVVGIENLSTNKPYFVMPEGSTPGFYEMVRVIVECEHGIISYSTKLGEENFTNCFENKYFTVEKEKVDVELTCLSLASHYTTIRKGDKLWLDAEFKGSVKAEFVTMLVRNKENPDMKVLVSLKQDDFLQYIDVFGYGNGQNELEDGIYYISSVYINPDKENCVIYSRDNTGDDVRPLDFYVEFEIENNTLVLSNLSLASHYTILKQDYKLWLDVELKGKGTVDLVTMIVRNKENPDMCALVSLKEDNCLQYVDVFDIGTQKVLEDGTYYISDLYINPNREDCIRYSFDEEGDDIRPLEFYVEFIIDAVEDEINKDEITQPNDSEKNENEKVEDENINKENEKEDLEDKNEENEEENKEEIKTENNTEDKDFSDEIKEELEDENNGLKRKIYELILKLLEILAMI